eukprot:COSAG02_NODE_23092_length_730_cov_1.244057_2_plen_183_part_01
MPLQLLAWLEGLVWVPVGDAGQSALVWSSLVVLVGLVSFRNEAQAIGDGSCGASLPWHQNACAPDRGCLTHSLRVAKFVKAQEWRSAQDSGTVADDDVEAKPSSNDAAPGHIDTRGGMMLIFMCPILIHISAWDFSFRIRDMLGAAAFEGTPMQGWEPPTLSLYHYLLFFLIALHFIRRFAEA